MHQHEFVRDRMWYNRREGCYIRLLSTTIKLFKVFGVDHFDFKGSEMFQCMLKLSWKQEPLKPHLVICEDFLHHLHHAKRRSVDILDQINSNLGSRILFFCQLLNFLHQIYKWFRFNHCFTWVYTSDLAHNFSHQKDHPTEWCMALFITTFSTLEGDGFIENYRTPVHLDIKRTTDYPYK